MLTRGRREDIRMRQVIGISSRGILPELGLPVSVDILPSTRHAHDGAVPQVQLVDCLVVVALVGELYYPT
jgi:hypothetical protein